MPTRHAATRWGALIHEFTSGGETVAEFCARRGLAKPTFYGWRRKLGKDSTPPFLPVRVASSVAPSVASPGAASGSGVEVMIRGGRRLRLERGFDPEVLAAALAALEGAAC